MNFTEKKFWHRSTILAECSHIAYKPKDEAEAAFRILGMDYKLCGKFLGCDLIIEEKVCELAYVAHFEEVVIVTCRGTFDESFDEWYTNFKVTMVPSTQGVGHVHSGYQKVADKLWSKLRAHFRQFDGAKRLWCCGHSKGGALAVIFGYRLTMCEQCPSPEVVVTFGQPRIGDTSYGEELISRGLVLNRFVNGGDIVTQLPFWPSRHFGTELHINSNGDFSFSDNWEDLIYTVFGFIQGHHPGDHFLSEYMKNLKQLEAKIIPRCV